MVSMNKKGVWRVIESVIAVLIIAGALLLFISKEEISKQSRYFEILRPTLDEIAQDENIRDKIIKDDPSTSIGEEEIINILKTRFPSEELELNVSICEINDIPCLTNEDYYPKGIRGEVYSEERLISSTLIDYEPAILRGYIWKK